MRPSVLPCTRRGAHSAKSVEFTPPDVAGSKKRRIPFRVPALPSNQSICLHKKELMLKFATSCQNVSVCRIRNRRTSCCVTPAGADSYRRVSNAAETRFFLSGEEFCEVILYRCATFEKNRGIWEFRDFRKKK